MPGTYRCQKVVQIHRCGLFRKIEKYSVQNATIYEYFYDKWVDFDEVMDNIPIHVSNPNAFLKANKYVEVADSSYCYLLNIKKCYLPAVWSHMIMPVRTSRKCWSTNEKLNS